MSALADLQIALASRLKADAGVTALVGTKVFDRQAPAGLAPPFLIIASSTEVPWPVHSGGWSDTFTLTAWSQSIDEAGSVETARIIAAATSALRSAPFSVAGFRILVKPPEMNESLPAEGNIDGRAARYRIIAAVEAA